MPSVTVAAVIYQHLPCSVKTRRETESCIGRMRIPVILGCQPRLEIQQCRAMPFSCCAAEQKNGIITAVRYHSQLVSGVRCKLRALTITVHAAAHYLRSIAPRAEYYTQTAGAFILRAKHTLGIYIDTAFFLAHNVAVRAARNSRKRNIVSHRYGPAQRKPAVT